MEEKRPLVRNIQKRLDSSIERARKKGQERLTIMVIPHGHDKIFSLQLNWLMITFLVGTVFLAIFLSGYGIYLTGVKDREIARLKGLYGVNFSSAVSLEENTNESLEVNQDLLDKLQEISDIIGIPESELEILPDPDSSRSMANRILYTEVLRRLDMGPGSNFLPPVYAIKTLQTIMHDQNPLLAALHENLGRGIGVYSGIPLGRALPPGTSYVDTSGFGGRVDPFGGSGGEFHNGFDSSGAEGTAVVATAAGVVTGIYNWDPGYGNAIIIQHGYGFYTLYGHLSRILINQGAVVKKGQLIGAMGSTGRATGSHLHYEVWLGNSNRVDPRRFICATDLSTQTCRQENNAFSF